MKPVAYKNIEISTHEWLLKFSSERHAKQIQKKNRILVQDILCNMYDGNSFNDGSQCSEEEDGVRINLH